MDLKFSIKNIMSDKVGTNEPSPTSKATPKLLRDVLLNHQTASEQVMQDRAIMEALKPNLLSLINNNHNHSGSTDSNGSSASSPNSTSAAAAAAATAMAVNTNAAALMSFAAEQNMFAPYLASAALGQSQSLGTSTALDLFAYCQYISSMMLFKAMAEGESPSSLVNTTPAGPDGRGSRGGGEKSSPEPESPSQVAQDYSMKNAIASKLSNDSAELASPFDAQHLASTPFLRKEAKKHLEKGSIKAETNAGNHHSHHHGRKFISTERRPRQAYNTKQLERLEAEFQIDKYLTVSKRIELSCALNLSEVQIKTWFQNRRTKWKKQMIEWRRSSTDSHKDGETSGSTTNEHNHHHHAHTQDTTNSSAVSATSDDDDTSDATHSHKRFKAYDFDCRDEEDGDDDDGGSGDDDDGDHHKPNGNNDSDDVDIDLMSDLQADDEQHDSD